jgi:hypothetical protein
MRINTILNKIKAYLKELTIVTIGVLIALIISNIQENSQSRKYQIASLETVKDEIELNYSNLKTVIEKQTRLLDTINKYSADDITISDLIFEKGGGLQSPSLSNAGLEFYTKNKINSIDFEMMLMLIGMSSCTEVIETKLEKLMDFLYPNLFIDSEESKMLFIIYLSNVLDSETRLIDFYEKFTVEYIKTKHNTRSSRSLK